MVRTHKALTLLVPALIALAGCSDPTGSDDPRPPDLETLPGAYRATLLRWDQGLGMYDIIGPETYTSLMWLGIHEDGTTTGAVNIQVVGEPQRMADDLNGRWAVEGSAIRLQLDSDLFLRHLPFYQSGTTLHAEGRWNSVDMEVELEKPDLPPPGYTTCAELSDPDADAVEVVVDAISSESLSFRVWNHTGRWSGDPPVGPVAEVGRVRGAVELDHNSAAGYLQGAVALHACRRTDRRTGLGDFYGIRGRLRPWTIHDGTAALGTFAGSFPPWPCS